MGSKKKKNNSKIKNNSNSNSNSNKDDPSVSGSSIGKKNAIIINDPRFSSMHTDPRFREGAPKHKTKVAIDSRFDRMFTDKSFRPSSAPVDKRGRPNKGPITHHSSLRHYYKIDENKEDEDEDEDEEETEDDDEVEKGNRVKTAESESESSESESAESEGSESESDTDTDTDTDTDEGADVDDYDAEDPEVKEEVPQIEKETHRLAVVNMDWRYVKADDLYVLLSSFVPPNRMIKSVAVYPSEFGLQRMKEEEVRGPVGLFDDEKENGNEDSSDDDIDNEKLREYEKSRMRYYFAVVECDSTTTADCIYKECDGLEFIQSSNALDLRFIPDDMEFKHPPRDVATEAPANYECKDFYSRALQHSKVNLSWDDDEPIRAKTLKRKFNDEQLAQLELKEFLTSDESESDDDEEENNNEAEDQLNKKAKKRAKYRALLNAGDGSEGDSEDDGVQDMEVTFNTGLEDISKHIMEKKDKKSETVWEAYLRKRREKKKARKNKSKYSSDDDSSDETDHEAAEEADDFFVEEPAVKKKKKKAHSKNGEENNHQDMDGVEATKEELELLLADDNGTDAGLKGYNLKFKKGKGKKKDNAIDESKIPSSAYDDPRFAALLSPDYVIDPTDPQFKRSAAYARQLAQKQKGDSELSAEREHVNHRRGMQLCSDDSSMMIKKGGEEGSNALETQKNKHEISSLVKSIKMKSKQVQLPLEGKTRKDAKSRKRS